MTGRNCCSEIVHLDDWSSLQSRPHFDVREFQNGVHAPTRRPYYNTVKYQSGFPYMKITSTLYLIWKLDKTQIVIFIMEQYVGPA
jgi:hypothetical protein